MFRRDKNGLIKADPPGKKVIIIGATTGIGRELAQFYLQQGCQVGVTGRRVEKLEELQSLYPDNCHWKQMDVRIPEAGAVFEALIAELGGMDLMVYSSGIGNQNPELDPDIEVNITETNADGYVRLVTRAYNYFKRQRSGHIVDISSLAGIRPLRQSPAYSASKRFQIHYTSCLAQKANKERLPLIFTTIIPGFIRTDMLKHKYPFTTGLFKGARMIYNTIEKRRRYSTIPGRWRWIEFFWRLIPNMLWEKMW